MLNIGMEKRKLAGSSLRYHPLLMMIMATGILLYITSFFRQIPHLQMPDEQASMRYNLSV